jgi:hypothetical protein
MFSAVEVKSDTDSRLPCMTVNGVADRDGSSTDDPLGTRDNLGELGSRDKQAGERLPCGCVS